ncbi:MAG: MoaF C-terminal domain-containing protein [Pseudomonadota bacterium]|nr:MoaF C-terminal domain-containing protein [Pseudomonadota bacterium]
MTSPLGLFRYDYDGGTSYEVRFDSATALHWHCVAGDEKGRQASETCDRVPLRDAQDLLSWTEADGLSVTQVVDWQAGRVNTVLSLPAGGERVVLQGRVRRL